MRYSVKMIIDIPYSSYIQKTIRLIADDPEGLITEVIPKRACRELDILKETVWKKTGWKGLQRSFTDFSWREEICLC